MTLSALFCNKYFIYWELGYQVAKDKNDTEMQGQSTVFIVLQLAKQALAVLMKGTVAFTSDASVSNNVQSTVYKFVFIYFGLCRVFAAACGPSLVAVSRGYSSLLGVDFSLRCLLLAAERRARGL